MNINKDIRSRLIVISTDDLIPLPDGSYSLSLGKLSTDSVRAIALRTATLRNIFYNVVSLGARKNNTFHYKLNGNDIVETIPAGFYSMTELLNALSNAISDTLAGSGIVPLPTLDDFKYNSIPNKVEITVNGNGSATPFELSGQDAGIMSINYLLGNWTNVSLDTLTPVAYQFLNQSNLSGLDNVHIVSPQMASCNCSNSNNGDDNPNGRTTDLIAVVPLNADFGQLVVYRAQDIDSEAILSTIPIDFTSVKIALTDSRGNPLYLDNSSLTLEFIAFLS